MTKLKIIVGLELSIAITFFIGADWAPNTIHRFFHNYFADIALPFGFYFLLIMNEDRVSIFRSWYGKALAVFFLVSTSEILQYFGIYALARVYDPIDFIMYVVGVVLAGLVDMRVVSKLYPDLHTKK